MSSSPSDAKPSESNARKKLNKSFALLKTHAARVADFTLQWQELEDYSRKVNTIIDTTFQQLQNTDGTADDTPPAKETPNSPPGLSGIPVTDGTSLMLFVKSHRCDENLRAGLRNALKRLENPGKLVLESLRSFRGVGSKFSIFRKCCVILLEAFMKVRANVSAQQKEDAMEMALKWKTIMKTGTGCWGILGFLMILGGFGLVGNFDADEVFQLFNDIVKRKDAPELLKSLGFADRVPELIERIISENKRLIAIKYIYAFELVDKFPPVPLLKDHAKRAKEATEATLKDRTSTVKDQHRALCGERVALKAIRVIVQSHELFSEYPVTSLEIRLEKLLNKSKELLVAELSDSKHQGKKRGRRNKGYDSSKKAKLTTTHPTHICPQTSAPRVMASNAPEIPPFTVPPGNPSYLQSASMFTDHGTRNMISSARVDSERAAHNYFLGEVSTITETHPFPHQPPDLMSNQFGASQFGYNRIGTPTRFSPRMNSAVVGPYSNEHREGPQVYNAPSSYFYNIPEGPRYTGPAIPTNMRNVPSPSNSLPSFYHHPGTSGHYGARYGASPGHPAFTHHLSQHRTEPFDKPLKPET